MGLVRSVSLIGSGAKEVYKAMRCLKQHAPPENDEKVLFGLEHREHLSYLQGYFPLTSDGKNIALKSTCEACGTSLVLIRPWDGVGEEGSVTHYHAWEKRAYAWRHYGNPDAPL